ncbi:MAG: hypothetical protein M3N98_06175 [Actinomycetota bacterium]|nr:hypothetical protein [Actinomycetota bacterium]
MNPTKVVDGQPVTITIKSSPGVAIAMAEVNLCRSGVTYQTNPGATATGFPNDDFFANCAHNGVSTSQTQGVLSDNGGGLTANAPTAAGESFIYRVGAGTASWTFPSGTTQTLTCGPSDPCDLVVELLVQRPGQPDQWEPFVQPLSYASDDPTAGCGGTANGVLTSGGSDRMSDTWINWTLAECTQQGRKGSATRTSFTGEGTAVTSFATGGLDLAYSAAGYDDGVGLAPAADPSQPNGGRRPEVNVPVALNATVLAVSANIGVAGHQVPVRDVKLTLAEVAGILNGTPYGESPYDMAIRTRNPNVNPVFAVNSLNSLGSQFIGAVAAPGADTNTWSMTRLLKSLVANAWTVPNVPGYFGSDAGKPRGTDNSLALAQPSFIKSIILETGRPPLQKVVATAPSNEGGGWWLLTDLETATTFGLTPVQIETMPGSGNFVAPTPATMAAAVPTMVRNAHGVLIAGDPQAVTTSNPTAYPLTYVEYAMAPAQPLVNADCSKRDSSQALLTGWLKYVTGAGQNQLAPGMVPLTAGLQADAAKAIPLVGAAMLTGTCATGPAQSTTIPATAPTSGHPGAAPAPARSSSNPGGGGLTAQTTVKSYVAPGQVAAPAPSATAPPTTQPASSASSPSILLPAFAGSAPLRYGGVVIGLLGIMGLSALAAASRTPVGLAWRRRLKLLWRAEGLRPQGPDTG